MKSTTKFLLLLLVGVFVTATVFAQQTKKVAPTKQQMISNQGVTATKANSPSLFNINKNQAPALVKSWGPVTGGSPVLNYTQSLLKPEYTYNQKDYPTPDVGGDVIASATVISSLPYTDAGNTCGFVDDYDEVCPYNAPGSPDVVYAYTATVNGNIVVDLCPSLYDTKVYVYDNGYTPGTPLACNDDACGSTGWQSTTSFAAVTGHVYYIVVDGYGGDCGDYTITVTLDTNPVPPNDDCSTATAVNGPFPQTVNGTTLGATIDCPGVLDWNAVWYAVQLPYANNNLTVDWCGTANMGTVGVVYYTTCPVNCSGYVLHTSTTWQTCGTPPDATTALSSFNNIPGPATIYYPAYSIPQMDHVLTFNVTDAGGGGLTNDNCAGAIAINEVTDMPFNTTGATPDGPSACNASGLNIWYNYTATQTGILTVDLCGSSYDTYLGLYDGFTCLGTNIACNDDACGLQSSITGIAVTAGQQYKIEVSGYGTNSGAGDLTVSVNTGGPCVVDCPPGSTLEGEADIPDEGVDNTNGGCNSTPFVFSPISLGETVCGRANTYMYGGSQYRDTDWYRLDLSGASSPYELTWTVEAEFDLIIFMVNAGTENCSDYTILGNTTALPCTPATLTFTVNPGIYWVLAMPSVFTGYPSSTGPHDYTATLTGIPTGPCVVTCPPGSIPENEPDILDEGLDAINGGCNSTPFVFSPINLGDTYCGHANTYLFGGSQYRDTDWYRLELTGTDWYELTWAVEAEFPVAIFMVDANSEDCVDYAILGNATAAECTPVSLTATVEPGVYWVLAMPSVFTGLPAGGDWVYKATLTGVPTTPTYCPVSATCDEYISNVTLNTINNSSACGAGGYTDYTAISTELIPGNSYDITITNGYVYSGDDVVGWIDWNQDLVFDPSEQIFCQLAGGGQGTFNFTVPMTAVPGDTRMRIRISYYAVDCNTMCGTQSYGETEDYTIHIPLAGITLDLKAYLEGPYNATNDNMNIFLNTTANIPLAQPYNPALPYYSNPAPAWLYAGTEAIGVVPPTMVDWVLVEIRDAVDGISATSATMEARMACLLLSDGSIVDPGTWNAPVVNVTIDNGLFVVLWHRNHLAVMNAAPIAGGPTYTYDFTTAATQVYGGTVGYKQVDTAPVAWALIAADGNADKQVNSTDKLNVWKIESGASGYLGGDFNLDSQVNTQDKLNVWKPNSGKSSQVPN